MLADYQVLKQLIENHISDEKFMYSDFDKKEISGVLISASSFLRKEFVMNKIKNIIVKKELKLSVTEEDLEFTSMFKIKFYVAGRRLKNEDIDGLMPAKRKIPGKIN